MPMRVNCKFFESRTYRSGETVRKCDLDLAPEAPWRCPEDCSAFTPRLADVNWSYGSLVTPPTPDEPASVTAGDPSVAALLDEAENIVNAVAQQTRQQVEAERGRHPTRSGQDSPRFGFLDRFRRRRGD